MRTILECEIPTESARWRRPQNRSLLLSGRAKDHAAGVARNHQILIRRNHSHHTSAVRRADHVGMLRVPLAIQRDTHVFETATDLPAHRRRPFSYTRGEYQQVKTAQSGGERADGFAHLVAEHLDRLLRVRLGLLLLE